MNYLDFLKNIISNKKIIIIVFSVMGLLYVVAMAIIRPVSPPATIAPVDTLIEDIKPTETDKLWEKIETRRISANNNIAFVNIPTEAKVYSYSSPNLTERDVYALFDKLNLKFYRDSNDPILGKVLYAKNENEKMIAYLGGNKISYVDTSESKTGLTRDDDYYRKRAEDYLKSTGLNIAGYNESSFSYLGGETDEVEIVLAKANAKLVEITYRFEVNGYPISYDRNNILGNYITVWVNNNGQIKKFSYEYGGTVGEVIGTVKISDKPDIINRINLGEAKFVTGIMSNQESISKIDIIEASLMYYPSGDKIYPVIALMGAMKTENADAIGYLVMDAIANEKAE